MSSPPEVYLAQQSWQDLKRFTGSVSAKWDPFPWMSHRLLIGTDYALEDIQGYTPYQTDSIITFFLGANFDGSRSETAQQTQLVTYDYAGALRFNLRPTLQSKTTGGVQYYTNADVRARGVRHALPDAGPLDDLGDRNEGHAKLELHRQQHARLLRAAGSVVERPAVSHRRRPRGQQQRVRKQCELGDVPQGQAFRGWPPKSRACATRFPASSTTCGCASRTADRDNSPP